MHSAPTHSVWSSGGADADGSICSLRLGFPGGWPSYIGVDLVDADDTVYLRATWEYGRVGARWAWDLRDLCAGTK